MILSYIHNIIRFKKWRLILMVALLSFLLKLITIITFHPDIEQLLELNKCPACYGISACSYIHEIDITLYDFASVFSYYFGVKNVFLGKLHKNKIVLKRLAHSSELNKFDQMLCEERNFSHLCTINTKSNNKGNTNFYELVKKEMTLDFTRDDLCRLRLCPTTRYLSKLLQTVYYNSEDIDRKTIDINIWTLTILNPEPLILQILPMEEGWPVPKYLGACGRLIVEEYVGLPLNEFYYEPWKIRAQIASSLLNTAYIFTFKSDDFGFYLTDVSVDNIAVDSNNTARFVDLENVIIVDKNILPEERSTNWERLQVNTESINCTDCLIFSSEDICNHKISDHNYYAICQQLLSLHIKDSLLFGGLLHDIPVEVLQKHSTIRYLIKECTTPGASSSRINAGIQLKELLDLIVKEI